MRPALDKWGDVVLPDGSSVDLVGWAYDTYADDHPDAPDAYDGDLSAVIDDAGEVILWSVTLTDEDSGEAFAGYAVKYDVDTDDVDIIDVWAFLVNGEAGQ